MQNIRLTKLIKAFLTCKAGETAVQMTMLFSVVIIAGVLLAVPFLNDASRDYAYQKQYGVDPVQTSFIGKKKTEVKRYTIRKSVLDDLEK